MRANLERGTMWVFSFFFLSSVITKVCTFRGARLFAPLTLEVTTCEFRLLVRSGGVSSRRISLPPARPIAWISAPGSSPQADTQHRLLVRASLPSRTNPQNAGFDQTLTKADVQDAGTISLQIVM